jgi:hypothetical protein
VMENVQYLGELTDDEDFFELYQLVQHPRERQVYRVKIILRNGEM